MKHTKTNPTAQMSLRFGSSLSVHSREGHQRKRGLPSGDWILLCIVLFIAVTGLIMVYNASSLIGQKTYGDSLYFIKKQLQWFLLGILSFLITSRIKVDRIRKWMIPIAGLLFSLLLSVLIFGVETNGARRWLQIGGLTFQPSELAKIFTVIYLAHYIDKKGEQLQTFLEGAVPALIVVGSMAMLILLEPDFGTTVVILSITMLMFFLGGIPLKQLGLMVGVVVPFFVYWVVTSPYRMKRILAFLNPWENELTSGFQIIQSQVALGSGGYTGTGLSGVKQVLFFLPEPHTDFIFSVFGEAFGLIGTTIIIILFSGILWRGTRTALKSATPYHQMIAIGMTLMVVLPALLNMGVVTGLLPTKGMPLPFMSYGGSSLLMNFMAIGFLYNISRQVDLAPEQRGR